MTEGQNLYCVKICVPSSPPLNSMFHMFFFHVYVAIRRVRLSILDCSEIKWLDAKNMKLHHNPRQKQSDKCTVIQMTFGATPPNPSASKYMFSKTVIGPMLDVEQALCPHHEVKLTFMKLKSQVGFLCWYGFMRHYCSAFLLQTSCALKLPHPRGMECLETSLLRSNLAYS